MSFMSSAARPIQVWAPCLGMNAFDPASRRDYQRAQIEWQGEDRLWLLPDLSEPVRWVEGSGPLSLAQLAIPAETFEVIDIVNIDRFGHSFPPLLQEASGPAPLPPALYQRWLTAEVSLQPVVEALSLKVPVFEGGHVKYEQRRIELEPGSFIPIAVMDELARSVSTHWPPASSSLPRPSVSPETEGRIADEVAVAGSLHVIARWAAPFDRLLPLAADADFLHQRAMMRALLTAARSKEGRERAVRQAAVWTGLLLGQGESTVERSLFLPSLARGVEACLMDFEGSYGVAANDLAELMASARARQILSTPVPVPRAFGWLGLFWLELLADLRTHTTLATCERCGGLIRGGHRDRLFCSRQENVDCFRSRQAGRQRRSRQART
jgi:hypothetical protein